MDTEIIKIENVAAQTENIERAAKYLQNGEIAAIPTETVYGLAASAFDAEAVKKIFKAKGRPQDNPLIVHIAETNEMFSIAREVPEKALELADAYWPGPLTVILPKKDVIPDEVSAGLDTVAIRMPSHPVANAVIRAAGAAGGAEREYFRFSEPHGSAARYRRYERQDRLHRGRRQL